MPTHRLPSPPGTAYACLAAAFLALAPTAPAQIFVDALTTPLGGSVRYDIRVRNEAAEELAIVSLLDGPVADPLIGSTLIAPLGFQASYDSGLGIVDLLGDTLTFGPGTITAGFYFQSLALPGTAFHTFEALDIQGNLYSGRIQLTPADVVVPEARTTLAGLGLASLALIQVVRNRRSNP